MSIFRPLYGQDTEHLFHSDVMGPAVSAHAVQFYEDDAVFIQCLSEFVGAALGAGGACIVISTPDHHRQLSERLSNSIDMRRLSDDGRYIHLEARRTLDRFMVQGRPGRTRFWQEISPVVQRAKAAVLPGSQTVAAFGEMVAILWAEGNHQAAIELEHLWNEQIQIYKQQLRCAYPIGSFARQSYSEMFNAI